MFISIAGNELKTVRSNITENVITWLNSSADATGKNQTLKLFPPYVKSTRFTSNFIKVMPNSNVSVDIDPIDNKDFLWLYYLLETPEAGAKIYNPSANWIHNTTHVSFNTENAKYIIFLVGNNNGFSASNTWKLDFTHAVNLVIGG